MAIDTFISLTTLTERVVANQLCQVLEDAGISVMLQHVEVLEDTGRVAGYRLLVPSAAAQRARIMMGNPALLTSTRNSSWMGGSSWIAGFPLVPRPVV